MDVTLRWRGSLLILVILSDLFLACSKRRVIGSILSPGSAELKLIARLDEAAVVFEKIMSSGDKSVPAYILQRAQCVLIMPGLKTYSFVVGAQWGSGFLSCRCKKGIGWTAPGRRHAEGGSFGLQVGGVNTNLLLLLMNAGAEDRLLSNQITIGVRRCRRWAGRP
jgi:lipid-binding SYLF domain-containing protein